ncbi:MAG: thermonuclease family protein [Pseudomonadota bacterium]|nr:thermonuclease family protein [Pseudomonadota bacterium]
MAMSAVVWIGVAAAAEPPLPAADLRAGERARVAAVVDGDTVVLTTGRQVRLVGLQAPKLPLGRVGFTAWPLAEEAWAALNDMLAGRQIALYYGGRRRDRYRRYLAHVVRDDGLWVQGALLRLGLARVYSFADNQTAVADMLVEERAARRAGRGIWALPFYRIRTPGELTGDIDSFQVVEGRVVAVAAVGRSVYLNFGLDWRTDFTAVVAAKKAPAFAAAGIELARLAGRAVRLRVWIRRRNGPARTLTHPAQIELLAY